MFHGRAFTPERGKKGVGGDGGEILPDEISTPAFHHGHQAAPRRTKLSQVPIR